MSIPGLGQLAPKQPTASTTRNIALQPFWEWRFEVLPSSSGGPPSTAGIALKLLTGTAERDGTELALGVAYRLPPGTKSKLLSWQGCSLEVTGDCDDYVAEYASPEENPAVSYLNLHFALQARRQQASGGGSTASGGRPPAQQQAGGGGKKGPRVLVCGPPSSGKTSLARTLTAYATRAGGAPLLASVDPREGMASLPGTLAAAVFATVMDVEAPDGGTGVGGTPSSGPSAVPVKLPLVYYHGYGRAEDDPRLWRALVGRLGAAAQRRAAADADVRAAGLVVDAPAVAAGPDGLDLLAHAVREFDVNLVVVLGSARLNADLQRRLVNERASGGEPIAVLLLDKSEGVAERKEDFMQVSREAAIKEYFFGNSKRTLSPFTQQVDFDDLTIYKIPEADDYLPDEEALVKSEPASHWTLAVMNAALNDPPEVIQHSTVMGFVYIADVDYERRRVKVLTPVSGRLGDRPLVWGRWPEPFINLLG